jgi:hypothetical protein
MKRTTLLLLMLTFAHGAFVQVDIESRRTLLAFTRSYSLYYLARFGPHDDVFPPTPPMPPPPAE